MSDIGKKAAAYAAVDNHCKNNMRVGIGSGTTIIFSLDRIVEKMKVEDLNMRFVPTSFQAKQAILERKLPLDDLETNFALDLVIDGADEVDAQMNCIKGGGGCLTQEKIVASCGKKFVIVADSSKKSDSLGENWKKGVPIEVIPMAYALVSAKIEATFRGKCILRQGKMKIGPVVTDNGNFIIDWVFDRDHKWPEINMKLNNIPGIVETGLFCNMASVAYFGNQDGTVEKRNI